MGKMKDLAIQDMEDAGQVGQLRCHWCGSDINFSEEYGYDCSNTSCEGHCQTELETVEETLNGPQ